MTKKFVKGHILRTIFETKETSTELTPANKTSFSAEEWIASETKIKAS